VGEDWERPVPAAQAADPALPSLKKDNCIINRRYRAVFIAQENIRLYIQKFGENNIGVLTVTVADCLEASKFQRSWHSFLNALKRKCPTGMWIRERQPRSGNWHAHAVVNVGWEIKPGFPFKQVSAGLYANVDPRLRELWKYLRDKSESHGFGRVELLPLKYSGDSCAKYFCKYLTKARGTDKCVGEEKCRLFGKWGRVCFMYPGFSFLSSRIIQKKKQWLAELLGYSDASELRKLTPHWWFHFGESLRAVVMERDFYMVGPPNCRVFDGPGLRTYTEDWPVGEVVESLATRIDTSHFNLFYDIGRFLYGPRNKQALQYAMWFMAQPEHDNSEPAKVVEAITQCDLPF
jgi:hypothetical protein